MKVLSYNHPDDEFFVAVTWDEYRQLAAEYEIDTIMEAGVEEVIKTNKEFRQAQKEMDAAYEQYIKDLYGIDELPDICLIVKRDLSYIGLDEYDYPFGHLWNGYSPWEKIETVDISGLKDLARLECIKKVPGQRENTIGQLLENAFEHMPARKAPYNTQWTRKSLTPQKAGIFCEYYAKMTLISYGVNVYTSEIDDHGIDFLAEGRNGILKFQVKSFRGYSQYVYMEKDKWDISDGALYLIMMMLIDGEHPDMYIIPASAWRQESKVFVHHDYEGKASKPDYGINVSKKNMPELWQYRIENMLSIF